ncbi:MAG: hypothetical protein VX777_06940 [Chlamydiota bacterium]|nr:hypothetical protein [Chlamydiota bacterium]
MNIIPSTFNQLQIASDSTVQSLNLAQDNTEKSLNITPTPHSVKEVISSKGSCLLPYYERPLLVTPTQYTTTNGALGIYEVNGKLTVLSNSQKAYYRENSISLETALYWACCSAFWHDNQEKSSLLEAINHPDFQYRLTPFVKYIFSTSEHTSKLIALNFDSEVLFYFLDYLHENDIRIESSAIKQLLIEFGYYEATCQRFLKYFKSEVREYGIEIFINTLKFKSDSIDLLFSFLEEQGVVFNDYHTLLLAVAKKEKANEHFIQQFNELSLEKQQHICDTAFVFNNPDTFYLQASDTPIEPIEYTINLIWLNKKRMSDSQEFLIKGTDSNSIYHQLVKPVSGWIKSNPNTCVNLWYDSLLATVKAVENTRAKILKTLTDDESNHFHFRDIRELTFVKDQENYFEEDIPVFWKVDMLKEIISSIELPKKNEKYTVCTDLDVTPMRRSHLFDKRTVHFLEKFGTLFAKEGWDGFENSFRITNREHIPIKNTIFEKTIKLSLKRIDSEGVFSTFSKMFEDFLLSNKMIPSVHSKYYITPSGDIDYNKKYESQFEKMPKKFVIKPPSHFGHDDNG